MRESLQQLLDDPAIPDSVRQALAPEFEEMRQMLARLDEGELHLAVFGRVSVGKSALLNALLGQPLFEVGVLHGTTTRAHQARWEEQIAAGVHFIDTPGINELDGQAREQLAVDVAERADLVLFVADGDLTASELSALERLQQTQRPVLLVLNKADRYTQAERQSLLERLRQHVQGWIRAEDVVAVSALPASRTVIRIDAAGVEHEQQEQPDSDVAELRERITAIVAREGKTLSAINAGLFAGRLADQVGRRITEVRQELAQKLIRNYCLAKGLAVAVNPIPVADLLSAAALDVSMVLHLSRLYGLPLSRTEAGKLVTTIVVQLAALMGAIWGVHLVSAALKGLSAGLSTALTAGAQGALAWYATRIIGEAATDWLARGKSWGEQGPKRALQQILSGLDRDSILRDAREQILARLKG
ncbi:MAG: GTP-binding protein [Xanthomonadales bacterium]|nr:GTP-binding protein [Xanthomonadales bacterium]